MPFPNIRSVAWISVILMCTAGLSRVRGADGFDEHPLTVTGGRAPGFTLIEPAESSLVFTNVLAFSRHSTNQIFLNGSGVAAGDVDGDGFADIYFAGLDSGNRLFRNLGGFRFEDITDRAGVGLKGMACTGVLMADIEGDGDLDLIVNTIAAGTHVLLNDGTGAFRPTAQSGRLNPRRGAMSLTMADIEGDGDLDLYLANYRTETIRDQLTATFDGEMIDGKPVITRVNGEPTDREPHIGRFETGPGGKVIENGEVDLLLLNDGEGRFESTSFTNGRFRDYRGRPLTSPPYDWGLSAMFRDIDGDGAPDLYIANDFGAPDRMWLNTGDGRFIEAFPTTMRSMSMFAMGVDFADVDRDGRDDFLVLDMRRRTHEGRMVHMNELPASGNPPQFSQNTLFHQRDDGTFAEIGMFAGLDASDWSWTPVFVDVDLDGFEDLLVSNGHEVYSLDADASQQVESLRKQQRMPVAEQRKLNRLFPRLNPPNAAFRNRGDLTFEDVSAKWGFTQPSVTHGMALADLDNDGDLDLVCNNMNDPAFLYRNDASAPRIAVRLKGLAPNTRGIGAKIRIEGGGIAQQQQMIAGGRYLSSDDAMRVFAAPGEGEFKITVTWPGGKRSVVDAAKGNCLYVIDESGAGVSSTGKTPPVAPWFTDISGSVAHRHSDEPFDDFERQHLLPHKLSQLGPGVGWIDVNGDDWDDLLVGSGSGGRFATLLNQKDGTFRQDASALPLPPAQLDQTAVVAIGNGSVAVGFSNYEKPGISVPAALIANSNAGTAPPIKATSGASTGPLAAADFDGDGDIDLFIGGRVKPGEYPVAATSLLLRRDDDAWTVDERNAGSLSNVGLVSDALWSDLDGDGFPELILACEWGAVRVFANDRGQLHDASGEWGTASSRGWWNGVAAGDFNEDGLMDLVTGNRGWNNEYHRLGTDGIELLYGDFQGGGNIEMIETHGEPGTGRRLPMRGLKSLETGLPFLRALVGSFSEYARRDVNEILGPFAKRASSLRIDTLSTSLWLNRTGRFERVDLPLEAQLAPVFGVAVADFDGDGHEDLYLAQNFTQNRSEIAGANAGRGVVLRGDGRGGFEVVDGTTSGVRVYGDQRGVAVSDFDHDGRVDLAVGQNRSTTRVFRNAGANPGVRVRVEGGVGNPLGIGAQFRLESGTAPGPLKEIHAGGGYWSQSSVVQILHPKSGDRLRVRWPGGAEEKFGIPEGAAEFTVRRTR